MDLITMKQKYKEIKDHFTDLQSYININTLEEESRSLANMMNEPQFWSNQREAKKIIDKNNSIKEKIQKFLDIKKSIENIQVGIELIEESEDESLFRETENEVITLSQEIEQFEMEILLKEPYDSKNAILEIHPGAGGTESQDWGDMLLRMYTRYAENKGYKVEILDYLAGEEAGIKSVTLLIKGLNAYGFLKAEKGVHRLIRISPFDASGRRHTSFASVEVIPEIDEDIEIEIKSEDLKIDTYRASGAGGQYVNKTDSAIRITHLPTGIVVTCQNERSQIANREKAMQMLKTKLYQRELQKQHDELLAIRGEQKEISWGSQIRSYIFHPYSLVKDHRTNVEIANVQSVMDGNIDMFIHEYLKVNV